jgi:acyl dehydratase
VIDILSVYYEDIAAGTEIPRLTKPPITREQLVKYAGASGDFNPLHYDDEIAEEAGLHVIAQGMLIMGFVGQAICNWIPQKNLRYLKVRFVGMTRPNDVITVSGRVVQKTVEREEGIISCEIIAKDQHNDTKVSGLFEAMVPMKKKEGRGD